MAMMVFDTNTNTKNEDNKEGDEDIVGSDKANASSSCEIGSPKVFSSTKYFRYHQKNENSQYQYVTLWW